MSTTTKQPFANDAAGAHSLDRLVRRFVVQEARPDCNEGWYDDPDIPECMTLQEAIHEQRRDCETNRGHDETYRHRIIERTERVVQTSVNWRTSPPQRNGNDMACQKCKCWQEINARLEKRAALFDECDALIAAVEGLVSKVDGVTAPVSEWRSDGRLLKDTAEWALLYCAWCDLNRKAKAK